MRQFNARVEPELYELATAKAKETQISLSDLIRHAVKHFCDDDKANVTHDEKQSITVEACVRQLEEKDKQIDQLHQLVAMAQSNQADTLKQLEDSKAQRQRRWWKFWS